MPPGYFMNRISYFATLLAALCFGGVGGWVLRGPGGSPTPEAAPALAAATEIAPPTSAAQGKPAAAPGRIITDLSIALREGTLGAEFRGNARDLLRATFTNRSGQTLRLSIPAGQAFRSANGTVILPRAAIFDFAVGESRLESLPTLAIASSNRVEEASFTPVSEPQAKLGPLLEYLARHPEVPTPAAQTVALALLENLPASAFGKFAALGSDLPTKFETDAFRVETADIIQALRILRAMGIPDDQLALTIDPQTKIEAMIDPLAHALAMQYYGIAPEAEWEYWRRELLEGDPTTRHYALHGIARYFPDVALPMLPRWARETRTDMVLRMVAIRALAETQRSEALSILKALELELGAQTELGRTANEAAAYLEATLNKTAQDQRPVLFRVDKAPGLN